MGLFDYWPLISTLRLSVQSTDLFGRPDGFIGAANYSDMLTDPAFLKTLGVTALFTLGTVLGKVVAGLAIALPLSTKLRGSRLMRPIVLLPMAFSAAIAAVVFKTMFQPRSGTFDLMLGFFGVEGPEWLTSPGWALFSVVLVDVWVTLGTVTLLFLAALDSVPESALEAASLDGAEWHQRIWSIQLPLITPTLFFVMVTQSVHALREFTVLNILTGGGPNGATTTLTVDLYDTGFASNADYGAAAARGVVLMIIVGIFTLMQFRLEKKVNY
jgi:sn-glycerol 3-phosphate transport system permease protein